MNNKKTQTQKAFKSTLIIIGLLTFAIIATLVTKDTQMANPSLFVGLPIFISSIISIVGLTQTIKAFKKPKTAKVFIALIVNCMVIILYMFAIITVVLYLKNSSAPE